LASFNGSIWNADTGMNNAVAISGNILPDSVPSDIKATIAIVVGAIASAGSFVVSVVGVLKGIKDLVNWIQAITKNLGTRERHEDPSPEDELEERRADQTAEKSNGVVPDHKLPVVDRQDMSTFNRAKTTTGEFLTSYEGTAVFLNDADASGDTTISAHYEPGESSTSQVMTNRTGQHIQNVDSIPTLANRIKNIVTGEAMEIKVLGNKFSQTIRSALGRVDERAVEGDGTYAHAKPPEEIRIP